ncbi:hypothetical protein HanPSC8_Chr12g0512621 [Helianthus annuus]|nr:hypothetical protein HanLR1_Chr12g0438431 [Helianthus annuus]KAJ0861956.1 hypothetical protein HanPSC8_Chr12g0512621 [Helianthus annuus]
MKDRPLTTKKLMHPYWRFLAIVYLVCISGNKSGIDTLTIRQTSEVVALVEGWNFKYSMYVFDDMMANVRTLNKKYWFKFLRFLQMVLEAKYPQLQQTMSIYDTKIMNHMVFPMLNQVRTDVQVLYQNRKPLVKFGAFPEIAKQVQAPVNVVMANEHDVDIIDAPPRSDESVENVDLTGVESEEEDVSEEMLMEDIEFNEFNEKVGEIETRIDTEGLTEDKSNEVQTLSVNPPHTEAFEPIFFEPDNVLAMRQLELQVQTQNQAYQ